MTIALKKFIAEIRKPVELIADMFKIDVAVFDLHSDLVAYTDNYKKNKGSSVHAPSIEEAIAHTHVMVNSPGHMNSCIGCRFKGKCPAKIEILRSIRIDDIPVGVITFTSFTKDGHDRITKDTTTYVNALDIFSQLIADIVSKNSPPARFPYTDAMIRTALDLSEDMAIIVDHTGNVIHGNASGLNLFSFCDLSSRSLYQLFPDTVAGEILQGKPCAFSQITINHFHAKVLSTPFKTNGSFSGALIRIVIPTKSIAGNPRQQRVPHKTTLDSIAGETPVIKDLKQTIRKLHQSTSTLLITGETGTGKGLLSKVIHHTSHRSNGPFVFVNCAGIPDTLFESELFGYEEGAFTGAKKGGKPGRFELAQGGTLVLDEISEIPLPMQAKLLHVLQEQTLERVGGVSAIPLDVRIIAISNQDMERMIDQKKFRPDLYFRLNVIPITIPSLKSRKRDIKILSRQFLKEYNIKLNKHIKGFSPDVIAKFEMHAWPGNIRELQNVIEYSVNMEENDIITLDSLPLNFSKPLYRELSDTDIKSRVMDAEMDAILIAMDKYGWDVRGKQKAARELGIGIRTLYRKLSNYTKKQEMQSLPGSSEMK